MRTYTAHTRAGRAPVLVAEAFSWGAFLFGPLWLLVQQAWLAAVIGVVAFAVLALVPPALRPLLSLALLLLLGLTGRDLVRWSLARRGYALAGIVAGRSADEAYLRLLDHAPALAQPGRAGA